MPRVEPVDFADMAEHSDLFMKINSTYGGPPNSFRTLGHKPELLRLVADLSLYVMAPGTVDTQTKWLVAHVASRAAGCSYCSAHTGFYSSAAGGAEEVKVEAVWEFESSPLFTDAERAALRLALAAGVSPNLTTNAHFDDLHAHFTDEQIVEILAVIALFGFFNRWNDSMATDLEKEKMRFAKQHLSGSGWTPKKVD